MIVKFAGIGQNERDLRLEITRKPGEGVVFMIYEEGVNDPMQYQIITISEEEVPSVISYLQEGRH